MDKPKIKYKIVLELDFILFKMLYKMQIGVQI